MMEFIKNKKNYLIALTVLFLFVSLSETTYSLFLSNDATDEFTYNTGILDLEFIQDEQLTLENAFPINDSDALKSDGYNLTIKNIGNIAYLFDLKLLINEDNNQINKNYIRLSINNSIPFSLSESNDIISTSNIILPGEERTFNIKIWLDINTPNSELGKIFTSKVLTYGRSFYKTLDESGANYPLLNDEMIPVYYDDSWRKADISNMDINNQWFDYNNQKWANVVNIKDSDKYIYDITRNNDIRIDNTTYNYGNLYLKNSYLDLGINNYNYDEISNLFRIRFNDLSSNINIISNDLITYYYDINNKTFNIKYNDKVYSSDKYEINNSDYYIVGYTYNGEKINFYLNGNNIGTKNLAGSLNTTRTFKVGVDNLGNNSTLIMSDILIYNRILTDREININYSNNMNTTLEGLLSGYRLFIPMTLKEYYQVNNNGIEINNDDVSSYMVWIPRYKYKLWNILRERGVDTYNAYLNGIDIEFERDTETSGVIYCNDTNCYNEETLTSEINVLDNNKYYTHPAFNKNGEELTGFWVSKYEISDSNTLESKYGNSILTNINISYLNSLLNDNNIINNLEWGAITYLTHSKYGICQNNACTILDGNKTNISGNNIIDTTTGNNYGVFDMSGSANEYVNNINRPLGDATKELLLTSGIWNNDNANQETLFNNYLIRGGNTLNSSLYNFEYVDNITSDNITTRFIIK